MTFENLAIQRVIVHETLAGAVEQREPRYSSDVTPLTPEIKDALQRRLTAALGDESYSILAEIEKEAEGSTFQLCASLLPANQRQFVSKSKTITQILSSSQTHGQIKSGLAVILTGTVGANSSRFVAVIKAETDTGFVTNAAGPVVQLQYIKDLFLTPHQRLYKIAAFVETVEGDGQVRAASDFEAYVYDHLMLRGEGQTAAAYFLRTFMGCTISATSKRLTLNFYEHTTQFINNLNASADDKINLKNNLTAYLRNNSTTLRSREFASDYFDAQTTANYLTFLRDKKFPANAVAKDTTLIKSKLRSRRIKFSQNIRLTGPADTFAERVRIGGELLGAEWTVVQIKGTVEDQA